MLQLNNIELGKQQATLFSVLQKGNEALKQLQAQVGPVTKAPQGQRTMRHIACHKIWQSVMHSVSMIWQSMRALLSVLWCIVVDGGISQGKAMIQA